MPGKRVVQVRDDHTRTVSAEAPLSTSGLDLHALRELVRRCDGLADDAPVFLAGIGEPHPNLRDRHWITALVVTGHVPEGDS